MFVTIESRIRESERSILIISHINRTARLANIRNYTSRPSTGSGLTGSTTCLACLTGVFSSAAGSSACALCPVQTWSGFTGATACRPCPINAGSLSGATVCRANAGYYDLGASLLAYYPFNPSNLTQDVSGRTGALANIGNVAKVNTTGWPISRASNDGTYAAYLSQPGGQSDYGANPLMQYLSLPPFTVYTSFSICLWYYRWSLYGTSRSCTSGMGSITTTS
jgi:hypothetical protein